MKILFLCNYKIYLTKMSRVRFHGIKALSKLVEVKYWGLNWAGYNSTLTVHQMLKYHHHENRLQFVASQLF